jgi:ureidoacrylate peracid hydrolase
MLTLQASPVEIEIGVASTAVIVVDMQNDFGAEGGMFHRAGIDISMIQRAIGPTANVLSTARRVGMPIVYLKMAFRPDLSDAGPAHSTNFLRHRALQAGVAVIAPDGSASRILIRDTWNTDILDELAPEADDDVVYKHRFSGFFETELDELLQRRGICVESTIRDAMFRDYSCVLLSDCTGEPIGNEYSRTNYDASLLSIQVLLGSVSTSSALLVAARSLSKIESGTGPGG